MTEQERSTETAPLELVLAETDLSKHLHLHSLLLWLLFPGFILDALTSGYTLQIFAYMGLVLVGFIAVWTKMIWTLSRSSFSFSDWTKLLRSLSLVAKGMYVFFGIAGAFISADYAYRIIEQINTTGMVSDIPAMLEVNLFIPIITLGLLVFLPIQHHTQKIQKEQTQNMGVDEQIDLDEIDGDVDNPDFHVIKSSGGMRVVENKENQETDVRPTTESNSESTDIESMDSLTPEDAKQILEGAQMEMAIKQLLNQKSNPYALTANELEVLEEHDAVQKYFILADRKSN